MTIVQISFQAITVVWFQIAHVNFLVFLVSSFDGIHAHIEQNDIHNTSNLFYTKIADLHRDCRSERMKNWRLALDS